MLALYMLTNTHVIESKHTHILLYVFRNLNDHPFINHL